LGKFSQLEARGTLRTPLQSYMASSMDTTPDFSPASAFTTWISLQKLFSLISSPESGFFLEKKKLHPETEICPSPASSPSLTCLPCKEIITVTGAGT